VTGLSVSLTSYLVISSVLFSLGVFGLLMRRNLVGMLIALELILNSVNINFLAFNRFSLADKALGQTMVIFVIALAAAEICIALSLVLWLYRKKETIDVEEARELKG
jgi:NADH:ubiquinone oxidoreductase subunit K